MAPIKKKRRTKKTSTLASVTKAKTWTPLSTSGESTMSVSRTLDDLQPELLEIIFSNLCDDPYGIDLLTCRAVNQRWKSIIDGMMVRACRQSYLSVQPKYQLPRQLKYPIIPTIGALQLNRRNGVDLAHGASPKFIVSQGRRSPSNPFFSNSLCITANNEAHHNGWISTELYQEYATSGFISNFAHHLTYLTISRVACCYWWKVSIRVFDLLHILSRTPNLKGFVLEDTEVMQSKPASRRRQKLPAPALPALRSIKIRHSANRPEGQDLFDGLPFSCWLLKAYSKQLTCLEVESRVYNALTLETYPKLQELQFRKLNLKLLLPSEKLPLRRLIIKDLVIGNTPAPFMKLMSFIQSFEDTLEHLELPSFSGFEAYGKHLNFPFLKKALPKKGLVLFPKLKVFGFPYTNNSKELALLKNHFLPKFMALETIEVLGSGIPSEVTIYKAKKSIKKFLVTERCWEVSRKLTRVHMFPDFATESTLIYIKDLKDD